MVTFDPSINLGHILTALVVAVGGLGVVWTLRDDVKDLTKRTEAVEQEMKKITDILVMNARHEERQTAMDMRINTVVNEMQSLRRGEGLIVAKKG